MMFFSGTLSGFRIFPNFFRFCPDFFQFPCFDQNDMIISFMGYLPGFWIFQDFLQILMVWTAYISSLNFDHIWSNTSTTYNTNHLNGFTSNFHSFPSLFNSIIHMKNIQLKLYAAQWEKLPHFSSYLRKRADFGTVRPIVKKWSWNMHKQPQSPEFLFIIYHLSPIWQVYSNIYCLKPTGKIH